MRKSPSGLVPFLTCSANRVAVLAAIATEASCSRSDLQTATGIPRSTVSRILDELDDHGLVSSVDHRYEVTPLGRVLAKRLNMVFDSIDVMQRLQTLLKQLSDTDPVITITDHDSWEILIPTSPDPGAPARRFADLLMAASHVRLLAPDVIPVLFDVNSPVGEEKETFEVVVTRGVLQGKGYSPRSAHPMRGVTPSGDITLFSSNEDISHVAGTIDDIAVVGLTDDAGAIQGYVETSDKAVRTWTDAILDAYCQSAQRFAL